MKRDLLTIDTSKATETLCSNFVEGVIDFIKEMLDNAYEGTLIVCHNGDEVISKELRFVSDQDTEYYELQLEIVKDLFAYYFQYKQENHADDDEFNYKLEIVNGDETEFAIIGIRTIEN